LRQCTQAQQAAADDVGALTPGAVASMIQAGSFDTAVRFLQAGLIHGWISTRAGGDTA